MFNPRVQTDAALGDVVTTQSGGVYIGWGGQKIAARVGRAITQVLDQL